MPKFAVGNIEKRKRQNRQGPPSNVVNQILCQKGQVFSQVGRLRRVEIPYKFFDGEFDEEVTNINYWYCSSAGELPNITKVITGAKMFSTIPLYLLEILRSEVGQCSNFFGEVKMVSQHSSPGDESFLWFLSDPSPIIVYPCHSLTDSLTDWLTHSVTFSWFDWCDPGVWRCQLKTCWGCYCCWCWWLETCWR